MTIPVPSRPIRISQLPITIAASRIARWGAPEDAIRDYDRAIALDPDYAMAYINRGGAYAALNDTSRALADMTKGIELEPERSKGMRTGVLSMAS